jgi:hypothetical protein
MHTRLQTPLFKSKGAETSMIIQCNGNVTELAKSYLQAVEEELERQRKQYRVTLRFTVPVALHYSKWTKDDRCMLEHTVKKLFFPNYDRHKAIASSVCYTPTFLRSSGYPLDIAHLLEVDIVDTTRSYRQQWANIAASLRTYRINLDVAEAIEAHVRGDAPHIMGFGNHWTITDKPTVMSFADVTHGLTIEQLVERALESQHHVLHLCKYGKSRDRSVEFAIRAHDAWRFTAASEYAGCGNGDYYCMYSPTMAIYTESD